MGLISLNLLILTFNIYPSCGKFFSKLSLSFFQYNQRLKTRSWTALKLVILYQKLNFLVLNITK